MPYDFKSLQFYGFKSMDACFLLGDFDLLIHGINAFQVRKQ